MRGAHTARRAATTSFGRPGAGVVPNTYGREAASTGGNRGLRGSELWLSAWALHTGRVRVVSLASFLRLLVSYSTWTCSDHRHERADYALTFQPVSRPRSRAGASLRAFYVCLQVQLH